MNDSAALFQLAVAALGGLAVGIEREWSARQEGDKTRFGGVRTFLLLGLAGGLAGLFVESGDSGLAIAIIGAVAALLAVAYFVTAWHGTVDATTEVAGVVALAAGVVAGSGRLTVASAVFAATALVLIEKSKMHRAVERLRSEELEAAARFAVLALVVLPLLPAEPIAALGGLGGLEPRKLWGLVLLFSGLSFAGYIALRWAGPRRGLGLAGLLGGVVSSTAVTINFARESRARGELSGALAAGALAASAVLPIRVGLVSLVLNAEVARALAPMVGVAALVGGVFVLRALAGREHGATDEEVSHPQNPLRLVAAIQMAAVFAAVLWLLGAAREQFGSSGLLAGAALLGLTDLDALTLSVNRLAAGSLPVAQAARALALGLLANTLFKAAAAALLGTPRFRIVVAGGLAVYALIFGVAYFAFG